MTAHDTKDEHQEFHDQDGHQPFDPEPIQVLPADEPRTPAWVPALGLALFAIAGVYGLAVAGHESDAVPARAKAVATAAPSARPAPAPRAVRSAIRNRVRPKAKRPARPRAGAHAPRPGATGNAALRQRVFGD